MKLTQKQKSFINEYITCRNGAEAARRAGYAVLSARVTASRLLTKANIKSFLATKEAELAAKVEINKHGVVIELLAAVDIARDKLDSGNMIRAWCEIAKMLGVYVPETKKIQEYSENEVLRAEYEAMSDEQLMAIINGTVATQ